LQAGDTPEQVREEVTIPDELSASAPDGAAAAAPAAPSSPEAAGEEVTGQ
jgi:hypothetical protein